VKCVPIEGTDEVYRFVGVEMRYHLVRPNGNLDPDDVERLQPLPGSPYPWAIAAGRLSDAETSIAGS